MPSDGRPPERRGAGRQPSAYELWTWERCRERILSLKRRLGYGGRLWVLGFDLADDGCLTDPFRGAAVFDPSKAPAPTAIPYQYSAIPEMYCLLSTYASAAEVPLTGEPLSPNSLRPMRRFEMRPEECAELLRYAERDLDPLRRASNPFFGRQLDHGDLSLEVRPLPLVPATLVLWRGDEELGDGGTVYFDGSVSHYLPGLAVELAGLVVWRLRNVLDPGVKWGYHQLADPS